CFTIGYIGCSSNRACCTALQQSVNKISFTTSSVCQKPSITAVEVRGTNWQSWVTKAWPINTGTGYDIKIYDLPYNSTTFPGTTICITAKWPCADISDLCDMNSG
ncbi:hypothetical protein Agub_g11472, partial [Astrephomene gubernaculifera]